MVDLFSPAGRKEQHSFNLKNRATFIFSRTSGIDSVKPHDYALPVANASVSEVGCPPRIRYREAL